MAHFAQINENNIVINVLVIPDEQEARGQEYLAEDLGLGGTWIQTSYNTRAGVHLYGGTPLRKNYAGLGYIYHFDLDIFSPPRPYDSWILNLETGGWDAPVSYPIDGKDYVWDENSVSWVEVTE